MNTMKQPELGRKIAELRKSKGLTQEELVERCNLNVRTIQRIEAGEVTPRSYTVKVIFAALDYSYFDRPGPVQELLAKSAGVLKKRGQAIKPFLVDLFNLKTNTMKKLTILSTPFLLLLALLLISSDSLSAQKRKAMEKEFQHMLAENSFIDWYNNGEISKVSEQYMETACMMPDDYPRIDGREEIREYWQQLYNRNLRFSNIHSSWHAVGDSLAIERGSWEITLGDNFSVTGYYLTQWRFSNGRWQIENEMSKAGIVGAE